jgi:NADH-quinone oxidoreductase subunit J
MTDTIFYILAAILILLSLLVVSAKNLLHAALSLIGAFFATAALYLLFHMEFVALAQIMIYIGGIVVFMVITILLTAQLGGKNLIAKTAGQRFWGLAVSLSLLAVLFRVSRGFELESVPLARDAEPASLAAIGTRLLSPEPGGFVVPFEVISVLLLAALIGAVIIARRDPKPVAPATPRPAKDLP